MRSRFSTRRAGLWTLALILAAPALAAGQEPVLVTGHGALATPAVAPQTDRFGPGGGGGGGVLFTLGDAALLGARLDATVLSDGPAPDRAGVVDPGVATIFALTAQLRLRPFAGLLDDGPARGTGGYVSIGAGGALTGAIVRPVVDATIGWGFAIDDVDLGPFLRWQTVFEVDNQLDTSPAHVVAIGVEVALLDARAQPVVEAPAPPPPAPPPPPSDTDGDGIVDVDDACPEVAEDLDGYEDEDGCPELDNDSDGVPDVDDACPGDPEDADGFEDEDGCPDTDNDQDGFLDIEDHCPNEPETVNGNLDHDGCPDPGLVELVDGHIILEETVTFDYNSSHLRRGSREVLQAAARLISQHPEWLHLRVEGHACSLGSHPVNQRISEDRAAAVRDALVSMGVPPERIDAIGLGEEQPRAWGEEESVHQLNRRVEIVVERRASSAATETGETP